jgi:hypothetical protein
MGAFLTVHSVVEVVLFPREIDLVEDAEDGRRVARQALFGIFVDP